MPSGARSRHGSVKEVGKTATHRERDPRMGMDTALLRPNPLDGDVRGADGAIPSLEAAVATIVTLRAAVATVVTFIGSSCGGSGDVRGVSSAAADATTARMLRRRRGTTTRRGRDADRRPQQRSVEWWR